jgi:excisionase family DNA binding protein
MATNGPIHEEPMETNIRHGQDVLPMTEVAARLGMGINQAYQAARTGKIPARQIGKRWIVTRLAFEAWLAEPLSAPRAA